MEVRLLGGEKPHASLSFLDAWVDGCVRVCVCVCARTRARAPHASLSLVDAGMCVCLTWRRAQLDVSQTYLPKRFPSYDSDKVVLSGYRSGTEAEKDVAESSSSQLA